MSTIHQAEPRRQVRRPVTLVLLLLFTAGFGGWGLVRAADPAGVAFAALWILLAGATVPVMTRFWQPVDTAVRWFGAAGLIVSVAAVAAIVLLSGGDVMNPGTGAGTWQRFGPLAIIFLGMIIAPREITRGWDRDD